MWFAHWCAEIHDIAFFSFWALPIPQTRDEHWQNPQIHLHLLSCKITQIPLTGRELCVNLGPFTHNKKLIVNMFSGPFAKQNKLSGANWAYNFSTLLNFSVLNLRNFSNVIATVKLGWNLIGNSYKIGKTNPSLQAGCLLKMFYSFLPEGGLFHLVMLRKIDLQFLHLPYVFHKLFKLIHVQVIQDIETTWRVDIIRYSYIHC